MLITQTQGIDLVEAVNFFSTKEYGLAGKENKNA